MSGVGYPLSWRDLPISLLCSFNIIYGMVTSDRLNKLSKARKDHGIKGQLGILEPYVPDIVHICPALPQIDFPISKFPDNVNNVGPILIPGKCVKELDPELYMWLSQADTILINMGSHMTASGEFAKQQAIGIRVLLESRDDIQVLWKLKQQASSYEDASAEDTAQNDEINEILGHDIAQGRVRIRAWLEPEPIEIMKTGFVVASVHHGGANSYFEACW